MTVPTKPRNPSPAAQAERPHGASNLAVTKAPPPIVPSAAGPLRSPYTKRPPTAAEWEHWARFVRLELWELIALALNVEPREFRIPRYDREPSTTILDDVPNYRAWVEVFASNAERAFPDAVSDIKPFYRWAIQRAAFVAYAQSLGMQVTPELAMMPGGMDAPAPATPTIQRSGLPPMTPEQLADAFACPLHGRKHQRHKGLDARDCWKRMCSDASQPSRKGLSAARISKGSGPTPSTFDPLAVGDWLIEAMQQPRNDVVAEVLAAIPNGDEFKALREKWDAMKFPEDKPNPAKWNKARRHYL